MPTPAYKPTETGRRPVEAMAGYGLRQEVIATVIGCSVSTLHRHYREALDSGDGTAQAKIGKALYDMAIAGDRTCLIFLAKVRLGFREASEVVVTDPEGKTPVFKVIIPGLGRGKGNGRDQ